MAMGSACSASLVWLPLLPSAPAFTSCRSPSAPCGYSGFSMARSNGCGAAPCTEGGSLCGVPDAGNCRDTASANGLLRQPQGQLVCDAVCSPAGAIDVTTSL